MDRFVRVLGQTEFDTIRSNDLQGMSFFRILENFIVETVFPDSTNLTKRQLHLFILRFKKYLSLKPAIVKDEHDEQDHLVGRLEFEMKARKEK